MGGRGIWLGGLLAGMSIVLGVSIATGRVLPLALFAGIVGIVVLARVPGWVLPVLLVSVSSVVAVYAWPRVALAGDGVYVSEALLLAGFAAAVPEYVRLIREGDLRPTWALWTLAGLLVASLVGLVVGLTRGASIGAAFSGFRAMIYLLAFVPAVVSVATPERQSKTVRFAMWLAAGVSVLAVVQFLVGDSRILFVIGTFDALVRSDPSTGFFRVRPPGLYLIYAVACWAAAAWMWAPAGRLKSVAPITLVLCLTAIGLSFNRNMIVGLLLGVAVTFLVGRRRGRAVVAVGAAAAVLAIGLLAAGNVQTDQPLVARFASLLDPDARSSALSDRAYETGFAVRAVIQDPLLGVGWGRGYGALATRSVGGQISSFERPWIHNQYLNQWVRSGIIGAALLVGFTIALIVTAVRNVRGSPEGEEWLDMGLLVSVVAFSFSALVDIVIANPNNLVVLMLMTALVVVRSMTRRGVGPVVANA